jgi:hypothetical protein
MNWARLVSLFAVWLALGVGAKIVRYAPERESAGDRSERLVREFLEARGWTAGDRTPITATGLYMAQSYLKPGCPNPLRVVALGASSEAYDLVLERLGSDAAFLENGQFTARPSATAFLTRAGRLGLGLRSDRAVVPFLVAPAPVADDRSRCAPPPPGEWTRIGAE